MPELRTFILRILAIYVFLYYFLFKIFLKEKRADLKSAHTRLEEKDLFCEICGSIFVLNTHAAKKHREL